MDKKIIGIIGAMTAIVPASASAAEMINPIAASSYADLLLPIANAGEHLSAMDAVLSDSDQPIRAIDVQYHHHHHHHNVIRRLLGGGRHHHHHHHHYRRRHF